MRSPQIGLLMLESRFPRPVGDIGHPLTFDPPALVKTIANATPRRVVDERAEGLVSQFINGAQELEAEGAALITTSCGFLVLHQKQLQTAVSVPVISSSLQAVPHAIKALEPEGLRPAILTISKISLNKAHLQAAGVFETVPIGAPDPDSEFCTQILNNHTNMDLNKARENVVFAAEQLIDQNSNIGAIILECTNMPPYASRIVDVCNVPVLSLPQLLPNCALGMSLEDAVRKALASS